MLWLVALVASEPLDSMNFDIHAYFRARPKVIPHCDETMRKTGGTCIYMSKKGAVIHGRDLHNEPGSGKQMLMDMMLRGVIDDIRKSYVWKSRWISFLMVYAASGPVEDEKFPVLGFGKRDPTQPGLLIPNPFFVTPKWWDDNAASSLEKSVARPWRTRSRKVLFRGACGPGARARFELLRMRDPNHLLDVGFTKVDGYATMRDCVADLASRNASRADVDLVMNHRLRGHVPQENFSYYRYLLHMPGSATGSYSRNLQYLWAHGAVVLVWKHPATEWYYQHLIDGVHYVSVDETNLYSVLQHLEANPPLQLALRRGGRQFAYRHLSGRTLVERWHSIIAVLQDRQSTHRPHIRNTSSCTCDVNLLADYARCEKCAITAKRGNTINKFVGLVK